MFLIEHMSDYLFDYLLITKIKKTFENQGFLQAADGNRTRRQTLEFRINTGFFRFSLDYF